MNNRLIFIVFIIIIVAVILGYFIKSNVDKTSSFKQSAVGKVNITTSFYPLYFFTSEVVADKGSVTNITPAGAEPHDYEPTTQDLARIEDSQLLVLNGGVEPWGDKIKDTLKDKPIVVLEAAEGLLTRQLTEDGEVVFLDPHIWLSPPLAKIEADKITQIMQKIDPQNMAYYTDRSSQLKLKLDELDMMYKQGLSSCQRRDIVTAHVAFGYLAEAYGLNQIAIAGLSPDEEPSPAKLAEVAQFVKVRQIKYIFFESLVSPKLAETIASETGTKTLVLNPLEGLTPEDLASGKNYLTVMKDNLANLKVALECL
ncbi:hypothetical protein A2631_04925 [Candidatus Daviesbacteria bacterium RIFCSPHIGHO2_01_FULL_44_29]|uniref:ABC transporter substrate-binding protein n=1 Tax=Candidatus Daviesbacteria bacterium RIFCSPHIGHO2_02_FULL_43_12 TaxID=1797776 RepID=A0A1F5KGY8_9BACT|nr:MAG: hypothetical protein A2631_04925 [Candidatus Daviesbacteria bacterium RIFCSPHIGHO2_01_FULL_44_29]OGE40065.1 MAG: hypothetical protein A3D25_04655 [Candidatus Daviesbacteria bacterium RIFCSPHIGHO2_02_FULL_43_12]OGE41453.1 MAG: hypothetical protein A3E86_05155 [Candidatus Daviesbacteria bacterium RIFCSPHIGHO2_12_FULL_47_45]OGE70255.1 MAG: hypothetical protein A3B55_00915 [Candidatus Daviesbacteria bacterium RIFCSPLOWO2_01_FULL_43_15]